MKIAIRLSDETYKEFSGAYTWEDSQSFDTNVLLIRNSKGKAIFICPLSRLVYLEETDV